MGMLLALGLLVWDGQSRPPVPAYALTIADQPIEVQLDGSGANGALAFAGVCQGPISPYDSCLATFSIDNVSDYSPARFRYDLYAWVDANGQDSGGIGPGGDALDECFVVGLAPGPMTANPTQPSAVWTGGELTRGHSDAWNLVA